MWLSPLLAQLSEIAAIGARAPAALQSSVPLNEDEELQRALEMSMMEAGGSAGGAGGSAAAAGGGGAARAAAGGAGAPGGARGLLLGRWAEAGEGGDGGRSSAGRGGGRAGPCQACLCRGSHTSPCTASAAAQPFTRLDWSAFL